MGDYIKDIRSIVGNMPIMLVACGVIVEDKYGQILLQHRSDTLNYGTPGGSIELNEKLIEGARRELEEETGIKVDNLSLFGIYSGNKCVNVYPNGDIAHYVVVIFYTKLTDDVKLRLDSESLSLDFYEKNNLPSNIKDPDRIWIEKWINKDFSIEVD